MRAWKVMLLYLQCPIFANNSSISLTLQALFSKWEISKKNEAVIIDDN